jgi:hypothetical protein
MPSIKITVALPKYALLVGVSSNDKYECDGQLTSPAPRMGHGLASIDNSVTNQLRQARAGRELQCGIAAGYWAAARGFGCGGVAINESVRPSQLSLMLPWHRSLREQAREIGQYAAGAC